MTIYKSNVCVFEGAENVGLLFCFLSSHWENGKSIVTLYSAYMVINNCGYHIFNSKWRKRTEYFTFINSCIPHKNLLVLQLENSLKVS